MVEEMADCPAGHQSAAGAAQTSSSHLSSRINCPAIGVSANTAIADIAEVVPATAAKAKDSDQDAKLASSTNELRSSEVGEGQDNNISTPSSITCAPVETDQQQPGSSCSSATDNRSSSSLSNSAKTNSNSTSTSNSTSAQSRSGSSMSKFKEKRPEPLKLNRANLTSSAGISNNNQEIPLDLSVKSAGYVQTSGFLSSIFNNLTATVASGNGGQMTTLETPRIVWQDNDSLLVKQRLFSSSTSANSQRLRLSSLVGDSPPMTPGTPLMDGVITSPGSMMVCSPIGQTAAGQQLARRGFLSPLFGHRQVNNHLVELNHFPTTKPLSAGYALPASSSQSLQSALMSAQLHCKQQQQQQQQQQHHHLPTSGVRLGASSGEKQSNRDSNSHYQYQAMLNAASAAAAASATKLNSPFNLQLQPLPGIFEAYLRAPRRSCSTENLTSSLVATNRTPLLLASDHQYHQHYQCLRHNPREATTVRQTSQADESMQRRPPTDKVADNESRHVAATSGSKGSKEGQLVDHQRHNDCFSYSGPQIAAAAAELGTKSRSPIINVIEGSSASSNDDTRDSGSNKLASAGPKALTPTSVANATANLLNIRLNSPLAANQPPQQQPHEQPHHLRDSCKEPIDDPLISAAYCREQRGISWSSANDIRSVNAVTSGAGLGSSLSSISTTLNTPTLISPSQFKGGSVCFLPSPTLSPMSSVFELPSPLLMFPPQPTSGTERGAASQAAACFSAINETRLQVQSQTKLMSDPALPHAGTAPASEPDQGRALCSTVASDRSKTVSELTLSGVTHSPMQVDRQQHQFSSSSEANLASLVTCASDKLGRSANNDMDAVNDNNHDEAEAEDDENMDIDLESRSAPHQTVNYEQRPASAVPRIYVSDCLVQRQHQHQNHQPEPLAENGWNSSLAARHRQSISKRSVSPQLQRIHMNLHHNERLESSSAPPDVYQGKARAKLKCVTGGSAVDFHINYQQQPSSTESSDSVTFGANRNRSQSQQQQQTQPQQRGKSSESLASYQYHRCKPTVAAASTGFLSCTSYSPGCQPISARSNSSEPAPMLARSSPGLVQQAGEYRSAIQSQQQQQQQYSIGGASPIGVGLLHSTQQHLHGCEPGSHDDHFAQAAPSEHRQQQQQHQHQPSISANGLHRSAQIHHQSASQISMGANQRSGLFQQATNNLVTDNQLMASDHNRPFQQQQFKRADTCALFSGMSADHSFSMGELDSLIHQQTATVTGPANQSLMVSQQPQLHQQQPAPFSSAIQSQNQHQRAASACSLSLANSCGPMSPNSRHHNQNNHLHHHHHRQQQQQQQQGHQLDGFAVGPATMATPSLATSFRPSSAADCTLSQQQSHIVAASTAAAAAKKYRCDECSKAFTRSDMLTRHKRLHSGDRPFQCNECKQEFSRSDHLSTHMRTHTGEKPYRCKLCSYSACRKDMITRHMKVHNRSSPSALPTGTCVSTGPNSAHHPNFGPA